MQKITPKQKKFADTYIATGNAKQAAEAAYNVSTGNAAAVLAHRTLQSPVVQVYLEKHQEKAKIRIVQLIDSENETVALRAAQDVLDRNTGKAMQRTQSTNLTVNLEDLLAELA